MLRGFIQDFLLAIREVASDAPTVSPIPNTSPEREFHAPSLTPAATTVDELHHG